MSIETLREILAVLNEEQRAALVSSIVPTLPANRLLKLEAEVKKHVRVANGLNRDVAYLDSIYAWPQLPNGMNYLDCQKMAIGWVLNRELTPFEGAQGGLLVMDMGMGKTLVALSVIRMTMGHGPTLFVCCNNVLDTIISDVAKFFAGSLRTKVLHPDYIGRAVFESQTLTDADLYLITYDTLISLFKKKGVSPLATRLFGFQFFRVVADESQEFRNSETLTFKSVTAISAPRKLCLTGTPFVNGSTDLESQLRFLNVSNKRRITRDLYEELHLDALILRMPKDEFLPGTVVTKHDVNVDISDNEMYIYKRVSAIAGDFLRMYQEDKTKPAAQRRVSAPVVLTMILRLRQVSIAPHLVMINNKAEKDMTEYDRFWHSPGAVIGKDIPNWQEGDAWLRNPTTTAGMFSTKMDAMVRIIRTVPVEDKLIVFSMWSEVVALSEMRLKAEGINVVIITGETKHRTGILDLFSSNPAAKVLIMTMGTGAVGLNITAANHVIIMEPNWQDVSEKQASARVDRVGQKKAVHVYRILANTGVERYMAQVCADKKAEEASFMGGESSVETLKAILGT